MSEPANFPARCSSVKVANQCFVFLTECFQKGYDKNKSTTLLPWQRQCCRLSAEWLTCYTSLSRSATTAGWELPRRKTKVIGSFAFKLPIWRSEPGDWAAGRVGLIQNTTKFKLFTFCYHVPFCCSLKMNTWSPARQIKAQAPALHTKNLFPGPWKDAKPFCFQLHEYRTSCSKDCKDRFDFWLFLVIFSQGHLG